MKSANYHQAETPRDALIQAVLAGVITNELQNASSTGAFGCTFDKALAPGPGVGGDPHWEMGYLDEPSGPGKFELYANTEYYSIEPDTAAFSIDEIFDALYHLLIAYGNTYPSKKCLVDRVIFNLPDYRAKLES